ncbi:hypothetical protein ISCGN_028924 [Ixodes scapularis]
MNRNTGSSSNGAGTFSAAQLRLPGFWAKNPRAWFSQVEAQFHLRRITRQESRYYHVVSALPPEVADELDHVLALPPAENAYEHIKETILFRKTASEASRVQQLLTTEELGDRQPSQLNHRMRQLLEEETESSKRDEHSKAAPHVCAIQECRAPPTSAGAQPPLCVIGIPEDFVPLRLCFRVVRQAVAGTPSQGSMHCATGEEGRTEAPQAATDVPAFWCTHTLPTSAGARPPVCVIGIPEDFVPLRLCFRVVRQAVAGTPSRGSMHCATGEEGRTEAPQAATDVPAFWCTHTPPTSAGARPPVCVIGIPEDFVPLRLCFRVVRQAVASTPSWGLMHCATGEEGRTEAPQAATDLPAFRCTHTPPTSAGAQPSESIIGILEGFTPLSLCSRVA